MRVLGLLLSLTFAAGATAWLWTGGPEWTVQPAWIVDEEKEIVPGEQDVEASQRVEACRRMLVRDSASPERWCDLGEAFESNGQLDQARFCFQRAYDNGPNQLALLLRAAEFYERSEERESSLARLARILHLVADYDDSVFEMLDRMGVGAEEALRSGIPAEQRPAQSYLRRQISSGNVPGAETTWTWVRSHGFVDEKLAVDYASHLLRTGRYEKAAETWVEQLGPRRGDYRKTDFLFDGDFELDSAAPVFNWRMERLESVEVDVEKGSAYSGARALKIHFLGKGNVDFHHVSQQTVLPAGRWRLRAWLRSEDVTTDQGLRLRVFDTKNRLDVKTEQSTGSMPWKEFIVDFAVPESSLVEVQVARSPSWKFDNQIAGTVWIDAVGLQRQ